MKRLLITLFATASFAAGVSAASAVTTNETSTGQLTVLATLKEGCTINFKGQDVVNFGVISALSQDITLPERSFTLGCSKLAGQTNTYTASSVELNAGSGTGSTVADRRLSLGSSSNTLQFQVFQGTQGETVWGDGSSTATPRYNTPIANGESNEFYYRVRLLARSDMSTLEPGEYKSTMIATVNYTADDGVAN
ncbi:spore coat protein U domain-containing protein [Candidatus Tokpelaia sp.]|uniref:spore coat protein U domain-containing protein n=1 Tax=Candidatus Tokpelaia sp. TaxID=2233777 RepID=UPI001680652D|nr:spore coat protein U domain-containing protein [Candidatus Tokpelaia sp.]